MAEPEVLSTVKELAEKHFQIKLGPGVVGKTVRVVLALCFVWIIIFFRLSGTWADAAYLIGGAIITGFCVWWINKTHAFAENNPGAALLEGAHLVQWQKVEQEAKGILPAPSKQKVLVAPKALEDKSE